jgi:hypothetical protein
MPRRCALARPNIVAEDPSRVADFIAVGPEAASDEPARRRMFAEE